MKSLMGPVAVGLLLAFLTGCVAVPPLITVSHQQDGNLKARVDELERRVKKLEEEHK